MVERVPVTRRGTLVIAVLALGAAGCRKPAGPGTRGSVQTRANGSSPRFDDATARAGIRFTHHTGAYGRYLMPESVGPGGAFLDYDGDGWQDVFLVNSSDWPGHGKSPATGALYRNRRDGTFVEVTRAAGLAVPMYGQGCAVGDYDNDGHDDLLVTCVGPNHLFHNLGNGRFREVTAGAGFDPSPWAWHTSAAWVDYDRDGRLDLFVGRYVKWSPETDILCRTGSGKRTYCGPVQYVGDASELYHNRGDGRFENVSAPSGIGGRTGKALGVLPIDEDGDGFVDLLVTNDLVPNHLWHNDGGKRFREQADMAGVAIGNIGRARAGMGVDVADTRNDGGLSFAIGNFSGEGLALFDRSTVYTDRAASTGLAAASLKSLTFGLVFLDADGDGWQDLFVYNGHVDPFAEETGDGTRFRQPPQLFQNHHGSFTDVSATSGPPFAVPQVGRGCAWGDYDNDGRPDLLLCENAGPTRLLHNVSDGNTHWIGVRLRGGKSKNRDGYGAEVRVRAGGMTQRRWVRSGGSFLSQSDARALFGLGPQASVESLEVRWLSGKTTVRSAPAVDRYLDVSEE